MPSPLSRTRLVSYCAASAVVVAHVVPVLLSDDRAGWTAASLGGIAVLLGILAWTTFRERTVPGEPLLTPALLVLIGGSLSGPVRIMTISIAVFAVMSLHGSARAWVIRTVLGLAVLPAGTALAAATGATTVSWRTADVLGLVPFVVPVGLVMRNILRVLRQQEMMSARDALLSSAGGRLLAAADVDEVHRVGIDLTNRMIALAPGLTLLIVRRQNETWYVSRAIGVDPGLGLVGRPMTAEELARPAAALAELVPAHHHWHGELVGDRHVLLGAVRPVSASEVDAFRTLVHQVVLAEHNLASRAELQHRAHHDSLTGLANRELFYDTLTGAVTRGGPGSVAVISVDLDDFKQVNDTYGHGGGDELLIEVAARLRAGAGPEGMAARLGGDEFVVLLTGLTDEGEAERVALRLRERILTPILVLGQSVRVGASIGISGAAPDPADLLRRADVAMYTAKAAGKNRVERFTAADLPTPR
ncbi:diguanylate cyclase domain-containing protein [Actinoplanes sp. NPDC049265]|uniref:diguanylate cyclase domain-containing protein n=1 Tax=Actinoplanes sp. NPDC049265 TaxID=3363902 RepID=UPI003716DAD9